MSNVDEEIARIKMQKREAKEAVINSKESKKEEESKGKITLNEVIEGIKEGQVTIHDVTFKFKKYKYLNGKLELPLPVAYFRESINTEVNVSLLNDLYGISFTAAYLDKVIKKQTLAEFKKGVEDNMKKSGFSLEWLEEGEIGDNNKLYYASYKIPTARGPLYNVIFYKMKGKTCIIGNYNCAYKNIEKWELIIKATLNFIETK